MMRSVILLVVLLATIAAPAWSQRRRGSRSFDHTEWNVPYTGRFTFVRIRYQDGLSGGFGSRRDPGWAHDYPRAERNFTKMLDELTNIRPLIDASNILTLDDPDLFRYPIAYLSEPGYWNMSDAEVEGLRNYLLKGGFLIVDDFRGQREMFQLQSQMQRALPEIGMVEMTADHPIFDAFFHIPSLDGFQNLNFDVKPAFYGMFEDNDPNKRLMVIVNYNNDIGDYWEWSDAGWVPIDLSNEAYKLGVNYVVYAMMR
jgi:hypothetical protein